LAARGTRALPDDFYARWARWFVADASTRTVLPSSPLTLPQYLQVLLTHAAPAGDSKAFLLQSTNLVAQALAAVTCTNEPLADWLTRRAVELAPEQFQTWSCRVAVLARTGRLGEAIVAMERALQLYGKSPTYWVTYGQLLEQAGRPDEAIAALGKAIALAGVTPAEADQGFVALRLRGEIFQRLGRQAEARADAHSQATWGIPPRPGDAGEHSIDLSAHYNFSLDTRRDDWGGLPRGMRTLAGVRFDVRGWVLLRRLAPGQPANPVTGIAVSRKCRRLHFLHGSGPPVPDGTVVARYLIHFADGQQVELPAVYGEDIRDLVTGSDPKPTVSRAVTIWSHDRDRRLCCRTWQNPRPDVAVTSLDFLPCDVTCEPVLVALTAEP
jgi:hypothetical protein